MCHIGRRHIIGLCWSIIEIHRHMQACLHTGMQRQGLVPQEHTASHVLHRPQGRQRNLQASLWSPQAHDRTSAPVRAPRMKHQQKSSISHSRSTRYPTCRQSHACHRHITKTSWSNAGVLQVLDETAASLSRFRNGTPAKAFHLSSFSTHLHILMKHQGIVTHDACCA